VEVVLVDSSAASPAYPSRCSYETPHACPLLLRWRFQGPRITTRYPNIYSWQVDHPDSGSTCTDCLIHIMSNCAGPPSFRLHNNGHTRLAVFWGPGGPRVAGEGLFPLGECPLADFVGCLLRAPRKRATFMNQEALDLQLNILTNISVSQGK
jgi:hypothetical protein